jgi:hypothetical protein
MAECCTLTKLGLKPAKETNTHYAQSIIGFGMLTKLTRFLKRIYNAFRMGYYDYVLLLLIISATLTQLRALLSILD